MKYVDKVLLPGEEVIHRARLHWILYLPPIVLLIVAIVALSTAMEAPPASTGYTVAWSIAAAICLIFAILSFALRRNLRHTTEFALTNYRILYKVGGFRRRTAYVEGAGPVRTTTAAAPRRTTVVEEEDVAPGPPPP